MPEAMEAEESLFEESRRIRDSIDRTVTFSRNVFLPLTRLCRDRCSYCHFRRDEGGYMDRKEVLNVVSKGSNAGCSEALLTFGEQPWKVAGTMEEFLGLVEASCRTSIEHGLVPHTNPGTVPTGFLERIAPLNGSLGAMLETTAELGVHSESPGKEPDTRLDFLDRAMSLGLPFTSGILVGIGESREDREESLRALHDLHRRHGTLQEVIVQNLEPPEGSGLEVPAEEEFLETIALARRMLPGEVSVQAPPNLAEAGRLLDAGVDDFGGVSPVTEDHVNPEHPWPEVGELRRACRERGLELRERLPIHPEFVAEGRYPEAVAELVEKLSDDEGYREEAV